MVYSGAGGGGGGQGPGDPFRDGGGGGGGRCIVRWSSEQFANASSVSGGDMYYHDSGGFRHFDFTGTGTITI
jgi:hypothetical protein